MIVKSLALVAPMAALVLLGAGPAPTVPSQLMFSYATGQVFHYRGVGGHTSGGKTERGSVDYTISIGAHNSQGWSAIETVMADGKSQDFPATISDGGVWTDPSGEILRNIVSFDPRILCVAEQPLRRGLTWPCDVEGNHLRPAGSETVTVLAVDADSTTLDVVGGTPMMRDVRSDQEGHPVELKTHMSWHDTITFSKGRQIKLVRQERHTDYGPDGAVIGDFQMHSTLTSL